MLVASVSFRVNGSYDGQIVSIRSESNQPYSELVNVTVGKLGYHPLVLLKLQVSILSESHQPYSEFVTTTADKLGYSTLL